MHDDAYSGKKKTFLGELQSLLPALIAAPLVKDKRIILDSLPYVKRFIHPSLSEEELYIAKAVVAIRQDEKLFHVPDGLEDAESHFRDLIQDLLAVEKFYGDIGGIIGYYCSALNLINKTEVGSGESMQYLAPFGIDLSKDDSVVRKAVIAGIRELGKMAEIYPVGGAADRLALKDKQTNAGLPAARLEFLGRELLKGIVQDLQAKEYLHYKLFGKQLTTPLALMTSHVKDNHAHVVGICEKHNWFHRPKEAFKLFTQPAVPTFTDDGNWCLESPLKLLLKPGGHGVIWKLAAQEGVFDWLQSMGRQKALIRQINNPIAGTDLGLIAFTGIGHLENKSFGFASCQRRVNAQEGMNVIKIMRDQGKARVVLSNVEYCDFEKYGIQDVPKYENESFSLFPSNTNLLFVDLNAVKKVISKVPFPGMLINFREEKHYTTDGSVKKEKIARIETLMQNIADSFEVDFDEMPTEKTFSEMPTYLTYNIRRKTISATKKEVRRGNPSLETPEGCFTDMIYNGYELLSDYVKMDVPEYVFGRLPFILQYHPALGPLYSIIGQKIQGGKIHEGSELRLEIADLQMVNVELKGSCSIYADQVMGHLNEEGILIYSEMTGKCCLKDVVIENEGFDFSRALEYWKNTPQCKESFRVILHGNAEFVAEGILFSGSHHIEVPTGMRRIATMHEGVITYHDELLSSGALWNYQISDDDSIVIDKKKDLSIV